MDDYTWQKTLQKRRSKHYRQTLLLFLLLGTIIAAAVWYFGIYIRTPEYALRQTMNALENNDAVAFQHIGDTVGFFIKDSPGDLPAVMAAAAGGLDELEIMPGDPAGFWLIGINFNQSGIVRPVTGVPLQQMYNRQECSTSVSNTLLWVLSYAFPGGKANDIR